MNKISNWLYTRCTQTSLSIHYIKKSRTNKFNKQIKRLRYEDKRKMIKEKGNVKIFFCTSRHPSYVCKIIARNYVKGNNRKFLVVQVWVKVEKVKVVLTKSLSKKKLPYVTYIPGLGNYSLARYFVTVPNDRLCCWSSWSLLMSNS